VSNGDTIGGKGGTADAIKYISGSNLDWVHIDVVNHSVRYYTKNRFK
jgi:hypothetical protein